jgi:hypothetical protein
MAGTLRFWKASSYSPLTLDLPDVRGWRVANVTVVMDAGRWMRPC